MSDDARGAIGDALRGFLTEEQTQKKLVDEVLATTKQVWGNFACKACGKKQKQLVEVPDTTAVVGGIEKLMNQAWGRPGEQAKGESGITFIRAVIPPGGELAEVPDREASEGASPESESARRPENEAGVDMAQSGRSAPTSS